MEDMMVKSHEYNKGLMRDLLLNYDRRYFSNQQAYQVYTARPRVAKRIEKDLFRRQVLIAHYVNKGVNVPKFVGEFWERLDTRNGLSPLQEGNIRQTLSLHMRLGELTHHPKSIVLTVGEDGWPVYSTRCTHWEFTELGIKIYG